MMSDPRRAGRDGVLALQARAGNAAVAHLFAASERVGSTGIPSGLRERVEGASGVSMRGVQVHYNSPKPDEVQALAYTAGSHVHIAPGQERNLPHELWHVVQQRQQRVSSTTAANGMPINDDPGLEREADVMGARLQREPLSASDQASSPLAAGAGSPPVAQLAAKPTVTSQTALAAPDGSPDTRTRVGVGEQVTFTGSATGNWKASKGTPRLAAAAPTFTWTAPARKSTPTISLKVGKKKRKVSFRVREPKSITGTKLSEIAGTPGVAGAGMTLRFNYHPMNVSFGNCQAREVSGDATGISGYFKDNYSKTELHHDSGDTYTAIGADNKDSAVDTASTTDSATPYKAGAFRWVIPNRFKVTTEGGDGKKFTKVTQAFKMFDATGKIRVRKAGVFVERTP
jgi:hypothetical protein